MEYNFDTKDKWQFYERTNLWATWREKKTKAGIHYGLFFAGIISKY